MAEIYLNYAHASALTSLQKQRPRDRFVEYYSDLYRLEQSTLDPHSFIEGTQLNYAELSRSVLDSCKVDGYLEKVDLLICATWSHEFDPDYSSTGPYISHRYQIPNVFDISDQGSIAAFASLKVLTSYLKGRDAEQAIVLGLEQTTIPRNLQDNVVLPENSGAGVLLFSSKPNPKNSINYKLIDVDIYSEDEVIDSKFNASALIKKKCDEISIDFAEVSFLVKKSSTIWKGLQKHLGPSVNLSINPLIKNYNNSLGMLPLFYLLKMLFNETKQVTKYIAILDEDVESLAIGMIILEVIL